jgi:hypothetical protein
MSYEFAPADFFHLSPRGARGRGHAHGRKAPQRSEIDCSRSVASVSCGTSASPARPRDCRGNAPVERCRGRGEWGITTRTAMSFCLGCENDGTRAIIQTRAAKKVKRSGIMGDKYYAREKFASAVRDLATSDGSWSERLGEAQSHVSPVTVADMPPEAVENYRALVARMTRARGEGPTLALISDMEARAIAGLFCDVAVDLASEVIDVQRNGERGGAHH